VSQPKPDDDSSNCPGTIKEHPVWPGRAGNTAGETGPAAVEETHKAVPAVQTNWLRKITDAERFLSCHYLQEAKVFDPSVN